MTPEYLRATQIAERLGLSERTIRRLIASGVLPSVKMGGARLVAEADLRRALSVDPASGTFDDLDDCEPIEIQSK